MNNPIPEMSYLSGEAKDHVILYRTTHQFLATVTERLYFKEQEIWYYFKTYKITSILEKPLP